MPDLRKYAKQLAKAGRHGDTMLVHITPAEAALLERVTDGSTVNPSTGLREFFLTDDPGWSDIVNDPPGYGEDIDRPGGYSPRDGGRGGRRYKGADEGARVTENGVIYQYTTIDPWADEPDQRWVEVGRVPDPSPSPPSGVGMGGTDEDTGWTGIVDDPPDYGEDIDRPGGYEPSPPPASPKPKPPKKPIQDVVEPPPRKPVFKSPDESQSVVNQGLLPPPEDAAGTIIRETVNAANPFGLDFSPGFDPVTGGPITRASWNPAQMVGSLLGGPVGGMVGGMMPTNFDLGESEPNDIFGRDIGDADYNAQGQSHTGEQVGDPILDQAIQPTEPQPDAPPVPIYDPQTQPNPFQASGFMGWPPWYGQFSPRYWNNPVMGI